MTPTVWNEAYSVGDAVIDAQHQQLIAIMNQLSALLSGTAPSIQDAARIFGALAVYVMDHFNYEEQLMARVGYPAEELARHEATHAELTHQIRAFQVRVNAGDMTALHDLMPFLQGSWLTQHIFETDRKYSAYLPGPASI
jgi:hemerythrin